MADPVSREELLGTDLAIPRRQVDRLPVISPEAYQHVGRYAGAVILTVFEQMGGVPRMTAWAETNPTNFYTKLLPKVVARTAQIDVSGTVTLDEAISRMESGTDAVDADFTEIDEQQYDL